MLRLVRLSLIVVALTSSACGVGNVSITDTASKDITITRPMANMIGISSGSQSFTSPQGYKVEAAVGDSIGSIHTSVSGWNVYTNVEGNIISN